MELSEARRKIVIAAIRLVGSPMADVRVQDTKMYPLDPLPAVLEFLATLTPR